jgi:hypothetical protein
VSDGFAVPGAATTGRDARRAVAGYGVGVDDLAALKREWLAVLDDLEATHRTAWLALFDGRLAALEDDVLILDFSDATKLGGAHGYERATKPQFAVALADSIERVTGRRVRVQIVADL